MSCDRAKGCLAGLAVGDALGTTLEFTKRNSGKWVDDIVGGGPFNLKAGQWTDDTSMALCLANSLLVCGKFDAKDQLDRYLDWYKNGYMSSTGVCFDIGNVTLGALTNFSSHGTLVSNYNSKMDSGNGSIMRLAPIPIFYKNPQDAIKYGMISSETTHSSQLCIDACALLSIILHYFIHEGITKRECLRRLSETTCVSEEFSHIVDGSFLNKTYDEIVGSGYVVESLEAALWCFFKTDNFEESVLAAVNLCNDADTTGAICGQIAGAFYGYSAIPGDWRNRIHKHEMIESIAASLYKYNQEI
jgi:ADP-ribosyl-[dinitrogen reductase] hydrolase